MTIAIVGNSPILLEKEYGEEIDSHDIVIRFNNFVTKGYEKHTGVKTTMYAFANSCKNPNKIYMELQHKHIFFRFGVNKNDNEFNNKLKILTNNLLNKENIICLDKIFLETLSKQVYHAEYLQKEYYVSTGLAVMQYIYNTYSDAKIDAYGFSFLNKNKSLHYFDKLKCTNITAPHYGDLEEIYFRNVLSKKINLHL